MSTRVKGPTCTGPTPGSDMKQESQFRRYFVNAPGVAPVRAERPEAIPRGSPPPVPAPPRPYKGPPPAVRGLPPLKEQRGDLAVLVGGHPAVAQALERRPVDLRGVC